MRIAQVAPLWESIPPQLYGGTERVVSYLTEELVSMGHEVTLFASGDSCTSAKLIAACPRSLWHDPETREPLPHHVALMETVFQNATNFDVLHFHTDYLQFPFLRWHAGCCGLSTLHGQLHTPDVTPLLKEFRDTPLVSISDSQRRPFPDAAWLGTVHHGLPLETHTCQLQNSGYLAFLGRVSPEKRLDRAIEIARLAGKQLKVAAKIYPEEREYFGQVIEPMLNKCRSFVEFIGEVGGTEKDRFLGGAEALLFPIDWAEPFGLVMIEALACGTPVIAWRNGSVPEIIEEGVTGSVVESVEEAVWAVEDVGKLDRAKCRQTFESRFNSRRMASEYVQIYERLIRAGDRL